MTPRTFQKIHNADATAHRYQNTGVASFNYFPRRGALGGSVNGTLSARFPCPRRFDGFRINIPSGDSSVVKYTYAVGTNKDSDGSDLTWTSVPFGGSATVTRSTASQMTSDLVAAPVNNSVNTYLFIRAYSAAQQYVDSGDGQYFAANAVLAFGDFAPAWKQSVGDLTGGGAVVLGSGNWSEWAVIGADFYGGECFTLAAVGDSLDQGWSVAGSLSGETNLRFTAQFASNYLLNLGLCVGWVSYAIAGEAHVTSMGKILSLNTVATHPDFMALRPWSPNDGTTLSAFAKSVAETSIAIRKLKGQGTLPILMTPTACGASGEKEQGRQQAITYVLQQNHAVALDIATPTADPNNQTNIAPAYLDTTGNSTHMSTSGYRTVGELIGAKIAELIQ